MAIVEVQNVTKTYQMGDVVVRALRGVSVSFEEGQYTAIMGPSGSGKSTLMNLLGCLDIPTTGKYLLNGVDVSSLSDNDLSDIRGRQIGFIFQSFNLITQLTVIQNISVPLFYQGVPERECDEIASELATSVGLGHRLHHVPRELSGGEQQRVAIARAMAIDPVIIMADEPTGNLDSKSGFEILKILDGLHERGKTIIMVTHDPRMVERVQRVVNFKDGQLESDLVGGKK